MDPIEGISGTRSAPAVAGVSTSSTMRATGPGAVGRPGWQGEAVAPARTDLAVGGVSGQVRPGPIGGDGRFEKLILAVQALRLAYTPGRDETQGTEAMRAAAEEIFSIDGVPQAFPSGAAPDAAPFGRAAEPAETVAAGTPAGSTPAGSAAGAAEDSRAAPEPPSASTEPAA